MPVIVVEFLLPGRFQQPFGQEVARKFAQDGFLLGRVGQLRRYAGEGVHDEGERLPADFPGDGLSLGDAADVGQRQGDVAVVILLQERLACRGEPVQGEQGPPNT